MGVQGGQFDAATCCRDLTRPNGPRRAPTGLCGDKESQHIGAGRRRYLGAVSDDTWASLADQFVDGAYASVKGRVRTYVMHRQLLEHLPAAPAAVLDVGGGAGNQSFPLAQAGYDVTLLDPSQAMLDKATERLERLPEDAQRRVTLLPADGENAYGLRTVAAPILDRNGFPLAGISLSVRNERMNLAEFVAEAVPPLLRTAHALTDAARLTQGAA